jgi:hypothetical protein
VTDQPASLAAALAAVQEQLPRIVKKSTGQVGTRTYKYGDLGDIMDAIRDLMISLGLIWVCKPDIIAGQFVLTYSLRHVPSGEHADGAMPLPAAGGPQATGSAITYFRRYALTAVLNIVLEDDDGRAAQDDHDAALQAWNAPARPHTRKADRHRADRDGPLPDDQWTTSPAADLPDDAPGTSTGDQRRTIGALMTELGAKDQADRHAMAMSLLDLSEPVSSTSLSRTQANQLITELRAKKAEVS